LTKRLVRPALRAILEAIEGVENATRGKTLMGIGNVLRHEYHRISDQLIWNVAREYLPPLKAAVLAIEAELKEK
jgi:uncharacterized protein with HEPN domain